MKLKDFEFTQSFEFGDTCFAKAPTALSAEFGVEPEVGDCDNACTVVEVKDLTRYLSTPLDDNYYEMFGVREEQDEGEFFDKLVIVPHELEKRTYSVECTLKHGDRIGTRWGGEWDFGAEYHSYESLDEARYAFEDAVEETKKDSDSNITTITMLCTETYEDCDRVVESEVEYFKNEG
jgi:hypothetical protein|nr:MAG TPA: hypothetical protein [Caudoviricetes sp.]